MTSEQANTEPAAVPLVRELEQDKTRRPVVYLRPANPVRLGVDPQLASWDRAGQPSQLRLASFLAHIDTVAAPILARTHGRFAVELVVGIPASASLTDGGRDLDNYLFPVAQRLGPARVAAMFGCKIHGPSWLAIDAAQPVPAATAAQFTTRITGSYERRQWKQTLHDQLMKAHLAPVGPGPVAIEITVTTGPARNWINIWKPLVDSFGPVLGEDPRRPFHPRDDRITSLGLHHHIDTSLGHDVLIHAWWANA